MFRGYTLFTCDECGKKFSAPDLEYMATVFTTPQPCPKCGSRHTMPANLLSALGKSNPQRIVYRQIWESMDKER